MKPGGVTNVSSPGQAIWRESVWCPRCGKPEFVTSPGEACFDRNCYWRLPLTTDRDPLLTKREKTHGIFEANAHIWQGFMEIGPMPSNTPQALALTMIYVKLSRLLQHPEVKEHWTDVAGYAHLGAEACPKTD
jgi:hypothetical protein